MNLKISLLRIYIFAVFMFSVPVFSADGSFPLYVPELSPEELTEDGDLPGYPISRFKHVQKQMIPFRVTTEKSRHNYAGNGYERYKLFFDGENKGNTLSLRAVHKYLGYATLFVASITGVSKSSRSFHCNAAKGTTALAAATVLSGFVSYGFPDLNRSNISSHRILHRLMGTAGMIGCAAAVFLAENDGFSSHPGLGLGGAGLMAASVILVKW